MKRLDLESLYQTSVFEVKLNYIITKKLLVFSKIPLIPHMTKIVTCHNTVDVRYKWIYKQMNVLCIKGSWVIFCFMCCFILIIANRQDKSNVSFTGTDKWNSHISNVGIDQLIINMECKNICMFIFINVNQIKIWDMW